MMDAKLLKRSEAVGASMACVSYFLPWASIATGFGSIEVRGLYVDFAWIVAVTAILHLLVQFARINKQSLNLPESSDKAFALFWLWSPLVLIGFFAWYGSAFIFLATSAVFGTSISPMFKTGLDYGYWLGLLGALITLTSVSLQSERTRLLLLAAVGIIAITSVLAIAVSRTAGVSQSMDKLSQLPPTPSSDQLSPPPTIPVLDARHYFTITKISGEVLKKDYDVNRYRDAIEITPSFKNLGNKGIVGVQGHISVVDGFGNEVYGFNFRMDQKLAPGEVYDTGSYSFEGNDFTDDDPYHKMLPLLNGGTAKYKWTISRIAFEDGSTLPK